MEKARSPGACPTTLSVRRNPPRRARPIPTPATSRARAVPPEILATIDVLKSPPPNPNPNPNPKPSNPPPNSLKVFLRLRPLPIPKPLAKPSKSKAKSPSKSCLTVNDAHSVTVWPPCESNRAKAESYAGFANVFSQDSSQDEVYEKLMRPIVEEFLDGKSGLLAAVGPSGSGKTHTIFGSAKDPGLVPRAVRHIFESNKGYQSNQARSFHLSMFEICSERGKGEKLSDLSQSGADIYMQQSAVKGLKEVLITDAAHAESLVGQAMAKRATAMTNSNAQSSRSQCIINIRCTVGEIDGLGESRANVAVLTFVDLAGAEREKKTGNQGGRLLESNFINNTSMVFSLCLRSLLEHQKNPKKQLQKHFQSSMLTRYLRDYLEGRKRMALILTVRTGEEDYFDTSFLLRQASPYMEIKFNNAEETSNLPGYKRQSQSTSTNPQKRVKLSDADACKGSIQRNGGDSDEICKSGLPAGYQGDETPKEVNANTVPKANCIDANREREYHIMQGFAKALWNVLKEYKEKVKTAESEVDMLTENLRNANDRYLVMEKELNDLKARCSCKVNGSANKAAPNPVAEEESGAISFRCSSSGRAGLQGPPSADVSQVHLGEFPGSTKICETISANDKSDVILREPFSETRDASERQNYTAEQPLLESEVSCDHVAEGNRHGELANKDDSKSSASSPQPHVTDHMVLAVSSGEEEKENAAIGSESILWSELESKKNSRSRPSNARTPESCGVAKVYHGNLQGLPTSSKNSDSLDGNGESDAVLRNTSPSDSLPSYEFEASASQSNQVGKSLAGCEVPNDQFSRDACHKVLSRKGHQGTTDAASCSPQLHKDRIVRVKSSGRDTHAKEDKENLAMETERNSKPELETKQASPCKPLHKGRPKRRLMPAASLLLRDISGMEVADERDNLKKSRGVEDESKRSRGNAHLLQLLKNHLPR